MGFNPPKISAKNRRCDGQESPWKNGPKTYPLVIQDMENHLSFLLFNHI